MQANELGDAALFEAACNMMGQVEEPKESDVVIKKAGDGESIGLKISNLPTPPLALPTHTLPGTDADGDVEMTSSARINGGDGILSVSLPQEDSAHPRIAEAERPSKKLKITRAQREGSRTSSRSPSVVDGQASKRKYTKRVDTPSSAPAATPPPPTTVLSLPAPSTPTNAPPPPEYNSSPRTVFHPGDVPSLEIFTRAPSPGITQALNSAMGLPSTFQSSLNSSTLTSVPSSSSLGGPPYMVPESRSAEVSSTGSSIPIPASSSAITMDIDTDVKPTAPPLVTPVTPQKGRPVRLSAVVSPSRYNEAALASSSQLQAYGSLTGSPYGMKRTKKVGGMKGKGKAGENGDDQSISNNDYCSACRGGGSFLCCDGCPRSFHFMCLEPPMDPNKLPEEDEWFCQECRADRQPKAARQAPIGNRFFDPLIQYVNRSNPQQFRLPDDIRNYFSGIGTLLDGSYSAGYDVKPVKFDRAGFPEERETFRLKNKNKVALCYVCRESAAPRGTGVAQGLSAGRKILSCDYCSLFWHMDCIDPPLANVPNPQRRWMCPNHSQHVAPKRRTLRHNLEEIKVTRPGIRNNGNIEIVDGDERSPLEYETMYINGKKYKVPEKVVRLDFWAKITSKSKGRNGHGDPPHSASRTVEEIFGGQSPLSTCPSSPEAGPSRLPEVNDSAHADAADALSHLASQGMSRVNGLSNQSDASSTASDSTAPLAPVIPAKRTNGPTTRTTRNETPPRRPNGFPSPSPNGTRITLRMPHQSPGARTIYNHESTAQPPVLQPYSNPATAKSSPAKLDAVAERVPAEASNGSAPSQSSSTEESAIPMQID